MKKTCILFCLFFVIATNADAQKNDIAGRWYDLPDSSWVMVSESHDKLTHFYLKKAYKKKENETVTIWCRLFIKKMVTGKTTLTGVETKQLYEFNCEDKTAKLLAGTIYDSKGNVLTTMTPQYEADYVVPETNLEVIFDAACKHVSGRPD